MIIKYNQAMRSLLLFFFFQIILSSSALAQEIKPDYRRQVEKEDGVNAYNSSEITTLDLLQALELLGVQIKKFDLGRFEEERELLVLADEYLDGVQVNTDTLLSMSNQYAYFERGAENYFLDFIDQLKVIIKVEDQKSSLQFVTYDMTAGRTVELERVSEAQFFQWRSYRQTHWKLKEKTPLMIFASSWKDPQYDFHRFCGVRHLSENDPDTEELLSSSPHYIVISYKVL